MEDSLSSTRLLILDVLDQTNGFYLNPTPSGNVRSGASIAHPYNIWLPFLHGWWCSRGSSGDEFISPQFQRSSMVPGFSQPYSSIWCAVCLMAYCTYRKDSSNKMMNTPLLLKVSRLTLFSNSKEKEEIFLTFGENPLMKNVSSCILTGVQR